MSMTRSASSSERPAIFLPSQTTDLPVMRSNTSQPPRLSLRSPNGFLGRMRSRIAIPPTSSGLSAQTLEQNWPLLGECSRLPQTKPHASGETGGSIRSRCSTVFTWRLAAHGSMIHRTLENAKAVGSAAIGYLFSNCRSSKFSADRGRSVGAYPCLASADRKSSTDSRSSSVS